MRNDISVTIRKTAAFFLVLLAILLVYVSYIQVIASDKLSAHPLNRRSAELLSKIERGQLIDRNGEKLAYSEQNNDGTYQREYPLGAIAANITGYTSARYGVAGLEGTYNRYLSGLANPERRLGAISQLWPSEKGANVILTIDSELQKTAYKALGSRRGAVVVLNPKTGAILAMVSKPSFDPEKVDQEWTELSGEVDSPLLNRAVQGLYPPGSIIKVLMAEAALKEKVTTTAKPFRCDGFLKIGSDYVLHEANNQAHGKIDLEQALVVSCNVTFGQLALDLGRNNMAKTYTRYGFNKIAIPDLNEQIAAIPEFNRLGDGDLAQTGIGQGSLLVTPMKMAMLAATFANGGTTMQPYIVQKVVARDGTAVEEFFPETWLTPVTHDLAAQVGKMMVAVVEDGTGSAAAISGIRVAGKTGTAENPHGAPHAWFIGFAPAANPEVAIAVVVENGGSGGGIAAPVARQVISQALR